MGALAGTATGSGLVSNCRQLSRSLISAALQVGKQIDGGGVWRALSGSGASDGGATVLLDVGGKVTAQPLASIASAASVSSSSSKGGLCIGPDLVGFITVFAFEVAELLGLLAGLAFGASFVGGAGGYGVGVVALLMRKAHGLRQQQRGQGQGSHLPCVGFEAAHHCSAMQSACLFCWRVHTPLQPFGPQLMGSRQSRLAW